MNVKKVILCLSVCSPALAQATLIDGNLGTLSKPSSESDCKGYVFKELADRFLLADPVSFEQRNEFCVQKSGLSPELQAKLDSLVSRESSFFQFFEPLVMKISAWAEQGTLRPYAAEAVECEGTCNADRGHAPLEACDVRRTTNGCEIARVHMPW
jgi:hypothetical protein